jgi:hypothetical protein
MASKGRIKGEGMGDRVGWIISALAVIISGCDGFLHQGPLTPTQMEDVRLQDVGELYRLYQMSTKKPPRSLRDLNRVGDAAGPTGYEAIRSGQVVVRWRATLPDTAAEPTSPPSDQVLAYVKNVPETGGPVLMLDRRIKHMTPEQFKVAKLAGPE